MENHYKVQMSKTFYLEGSGNVLLMHNALPILKKHGAISGFDIETFKNGAQVTVVGIEDFGEFYPGNHVYLADGRECLYIGHHPEHPLHVLETPENEFIIRTTDQILKEKPKPKEDKPTPLDIPWANINERWIYAAMNSNKEVCFYDMEPTRDSSIWHLSGKGEAVETNGVFAIPTDDIDWKQSLTRRPEFEASISDSEAVVNKCNDEFSIGYRTTLTPISEAVAKRTHQTYLRDLFNLTAHFESLATGHVKEADKPRSTPIEGSMFKIEAPEPISFLELMKRERIIPVVIKNV